MSKDVVERVAVAVAAHMNGSMPEDAFDTRQIARAAIEAMREPTEPMLAALNGYAQCSGYLPEGWSAAIDVALSGEPSR